MEKVVFDIGHGGKETGAVANGIIEKDINLQVGLHAKKLIANYEVEVYFTRETDKTVSLTERAAFVKKINPDLCWSIHHNSWNKTARGAEIIDAHYDTEDDKLSMDWLQRMAAAGMPTRRRFSKLDERGSDWYAMIRNIWDNDTDAVISEGGFIDNPDDFKIMMSEGFLYKEAVCIVESIVKYLNLKPKKAVESDRIRIRVNGTFIETDVEPFIKDNRIMVPVRLIAEALGKKVEWDSVNQIVDIS